MQDTSITRLASSVPSIFDRFGLRSAGGAAGTEPASLRDVSLCNQISYDTRNGGGGNCTRVSFDATNDHSSGYGMRPDGWPEHGREDEAIRQLVASWHRLTPCASGPRSWTLPDPRWISIGDLDPTVGRSDSKHDEAIPFDGSGSDSHPDVPYFGEVKPRRSRSASTTTTPAAAVGSSGGSRSLFQGRPFVTISVSKPDRLALSC